MFAPPLSLDSRAPQYAAVQPVRLGFPRDGQFPGLHHVLDAHGQPAVADAEGVSAQQVAKEPPFAKFPRGFGERAADGKIVSVLQQAAQAVEFLPRRFGAVLVAGDDANSAAAIPALAIACLLYTSRCV